ncbi:glutamine amidotransferase-related protein [Candidatus Caldatribacterium saccharofermentans]|uniref:Type 1 glutamine amidotransferase n=1 Tax=Candidatus Caldatribacterium saccharofermentans TaxID=1454753 RepID=A0A7V4TZX6_9BACT
MRILVIQHVAIEDLGLLGAAFQQRGFEVDIRLMEDPQVFLSPSVKPYGALVILGGPMGAYEEDRYPYLFQVERLIREAYHAGLPTLGVCLGGQLIARAFGAWVGPSMVKEIGWYRIRLTEEGKSSPLFAGLPDDFFVFQWHGDTFALPKGAVLLASGDSCRNQAFVYGERIFALQFHLEVTEAMVALWSEVYREELLRFGGAAFPERLREETKRRFEEDRDIRRRFLENLCWVIAGGSRGCGLLSGK